MFDRVAALLKKEFLQVFRDPRMKMTIFVGPIVQIFIFGYAATMDITNVPIAVFDRDNTKESREVIRQFSYSKYFDIKQYITSEEEQRKVIDKFSVLAVLKFDRGFGRAVQGNKTAQLQFVVDGTDSNAAMIIIGYAGSIISSYNSNVLRQRSSIFLRTKDIYPVVDLRDRKWFNDNLISRNYYLPGVISLIVSIMSLLLSSMAVVREKEIGTMEQLIVSPLRPIELIIGKITPFAVIALGQVTLITLVGTLWFRVPMRGSLILLFFATLIYLLTTLGAGLIISTVSATQQEAMMSVFLFFFPASLLSGFAYPVPNMPQVIQYLTYLNPLRFYLYIIRNIFLKGVGIEVLWSQMLILLVMGTVTITIASARFKKRLG